MHKVIITGADGFIGSYTVDYFLSQGVEVLAFDIEELPHRLKENPLLTYIQLDITDTNALMNIVEYNKYDTFIHFAWAGSAGPGRGDYNLQMSNALMTVECMKAAKELGCTRFVCAGSIMEKEVVAAVGTQGSKPGMAYIYGMGKLIAHHMCKCVAAQIGIEFVWPIITNAYGIGEFSPRFVNTTIRKIINHESLQFTSGIQNYDFVYVVDVARAIYLITRNGKPFCEYMIGSSNAKPLREYIIEMVSALDPDAEPIFGDIPFTGTNMPISAFDTADTAKDTGFKAEISFAEGTRKTMKWLGTL